MSKKSSLAELVESAAAVAPAPTPQYEMAPEMVLVKRLDVDSASEIEKNAHDMVGTLSNKGKVIAVAAEETWLKLGDTVLFSEHAANDVTLDRIEHLILNRKQIYMRLPV
jgi:co-chaperonin GroES (HSP10)